MQLGKICYDNAKNTIYVTVTNPPPIDVINSGSDLSSLNTLSENLEYLDGNHLKVYQTYL